MKSVHRLRSFALAAMLLAPVMGVGIVNHEAAGLGIREDSRRITGNLSRFVPHLF